MLHLLTDATVSVVVLVSALLLGVTGWLWLDAITTMGVGATVIWCAWNLLAEAIAFKLDSAPRHIEVDRIRQAPG